MPRGGVGGTREVPQEWELGFGVALHPAMPSLLLLLSRSRWAWVGQGWSCWKQQPGAWACFCEPNLHSPGATLGIQLDLWSSCSLSLTLGDSIQETNCIFCQIWEDAGRELLNMY